MVQKGVQKVAKTGNKLPKSYQTAKCYKILPKIGKSYQELPKIPKMLLKVARSLQNLPKVATSCQKVARNCRKLAS